ncbi:protein NEOXANTHIN-DEFICIENT 1 isoform X3 [Coffea arabica]|uniref:Protein NEOXANTHIN-DEFICIENT 1 isoform X3 n=1 Tax=Coffea arabica TaxID=13443 RepID=A0ABM4WB03_COFAR
MKEENDVNGSKILKVEPMDHRKTHSPSGYGKPPWVFRGSALYQLHLVKAETARAFIPKEFRLVEAFGYTLGGFFLANYDDSPAGKFDELVVIAGTVWNPPTSCAWAARVLVNSDEACIHGQKDIGLPSQVAKFSKTVRAIAKTSETKTSGFLNMVGMFSLDGPKNSMDVQVSEMKGMEEMNICNINFSAPASELESSGWMGPLVKLSLPSFRAVLAVGGPSTTITSSSILARLSAGFSLLFCMYSSCHSIFRLLAKPLLESFLPAIRRVLFQIH